MASDEAPRHRQHGHRLGLLARPRAAGPGRGAASRGVRPPVLPAGAARGPRPAGPARRLRRRARALELRAPTRSRYGQGARLQPGVRAARVAVLAHGGRAGQRRHAVPRRLDDDGAQRPRRRHPLADPSRHPRPARQRRRVDGGARSGRPGRRGHADGVVHPRRDRSPQPRGRAGASPRAADRRARPGVGRRRGLAGDAPPRRRPHRRAARAVAVAGPRRA